MSQEIIFHCCHSSFPVCHGVINMSKYPESTAPSSRRAKKNQAMRFRQTFLYGAGLALARTVSTLDTPQDSNGILPSLKNLLQVSPAFSGDGITMFPGLHPNHDNSDPNHLVPDLLKTLHYSQEGHRCMFKLPPSLPLLFL